MRETRIYVSISCFSVFSPGWSVELVRGVLQPPIFQHFALVAEVQGFRKGFFPPNSGCQMDASPQVYTCLENRGFTPQIGPGFFKKNFGGIRRSSVRRRGPSAAAFRLPEETLHPEAKRYGVRPDAKRRFFQTLRAQLDTKPRSEQNFFPCQNFEKLRFRLGMLEELISRVGGAAIFHGFLRGLHYALLPVSLLQDTPAKH